MGYYTLDFRNKDVNGVLFSIRIFPEFKKNIQFRRYVKLQNIAANMGGIIKFLLISGFVISFYFSHTKRNCFILNTILDSY